MTEKICQKLLGKDIFLDFSRDKIGEMIDPLLSTELQTTQKSSTVKPAI